MVEGSHPRCDGPSKLTGAPGQQVKKTGAREGMKRGQVYREAQGGYRCWFSLIVTLLVSVACASGQEAGSGTTPQANQTTPPEQAVKTNPDAKTEVSTKDTNTTFKLRVNLVQVRVVVRDENGKPVENLKRDDFQVYDQGKPQVISTFGIETAQSRR